MREGVQLTRYRARPVKVRRIDTPPGLWARHPPVRVRKTVPDSWVQLTLHEGKNRQVRRMLAAVGYPVLRLIRCQIGHWSLQGLQPGQSRLVELQKYPG